MKNLLTAIVGILSLTLFSCQKEVDDIFKSNGGGTNAPGLLKRMVTKQGTDSSADDYFYNSAGKITGINTTQVTSGSSVVTNETILRNGQGIIQKIITKSSDLAQYGLDSLVSVINYDAASHHYTSRVLAFSVLGVTATDSSAFVYDASGKIVTEEDYIDDSLGNNQNSKYDFTYTGSNMTGMKGYDLSSGTPDLQITYVFEYDAKPSPLILGNEAVVLNNTFQWLSANNSLKMTTTLVGDPMIHLTTYDYNYNTQNKPATANVVSDGQSVGAVSYYYN